MPDYLNYIVLGFSAFGGLIVARFCYYLEDAGFFFIGGLGGFMVGTILYYLILHTFITHKVNIIIFLYFYI